MAGMGSTGTVNITPEMMEAAVKAIADYRETTEDLHKNVNTEVTNLISNDFTGAASAGFYDFYTSNIEPATGSSLTEALNTLEEICSSIKAAIPDADGVDEQLGAANKQ